MDDYPWKFGTEIQNKMNSKTIQAIEEFLP